jgi:hypothetical protein
MTIDKNLQELHAPLDIEIINILLSIIPETWWSVRLDVEYMKISDDEVGYPIKISNNEGEKDIVMPPDELYEKIGKHAAIFREHGKQWKKLKYNAAYDESTEDWQYTIDYDY